MGIKLIGISGGSGSGKSRFVNAVKESFTNRKVTFISLDDYYFPKEEQSVDENGVENFDLPSSIDIKSLLKDIETLENGNRVEKYEYTFNNRDKVGDIIVFEPNPIVFIEGLFLYHYPALMNRFHLKLFIQASDKIKIDRRINRDQKERNYPIEDVLYRYENHVLPSYKKYMEPYIDDVDLIINNNTNFDVGLAVINQYINHLLDSE